LFGRMNRGVGSYTETSGQPAYQRLGISSSETDT
jgi:hypothetical protein